MSLTVHYVSCGSLFSRVLKEKSLCNCRLHYCVNVGKLLPTEAVSVVVVITDSGATSLVLTVALNADK